MPFIDLSWFRFLGDWQSNFRVRGDLERRRAGDCLGGGGSEGLRLSGEDSRSFGRVKFVTKVITSLIDGLGAYDAGPFKVSLYLKYTQLSFWVKWAVRGLFLPSFSGIFFSDGCGTAFQRLCCPELPLRLWVVLTWRTECHLWRHVGLSGSWLDGDESRWCRRTYLLFPRCYFTAWNLTLICLKGRTVLCFCSAWSNANFADGTRGSGCLCRPQWLFEQTW